MQCTAWGTLGEKLATSLHKGTRVVAAAWLNTYTKGVAIGGEDVDLTTASFRVTAIDRDLRWVEADVAQVNGKGRTARTGLPEQPNDPGQPTPETSEDEVF